MKLEEIKESKIAYKKAVGRNIVEARMKKFMKQKDLAEKLGVSNVQVSKWERGIAVPRDKTASKINEMLDSNILEVN